MVIVVPDEESSGKVAGMPDIISRGFIYMKESGVLVDKVKQMVVQKLKLKKGQIIEWPFVRREIEEVVSHFLRKETGRRPLIVPVLIEV